MKKQLVLLTPLILLGCAAPLTQEAQRIMTIQDGGVLAMMNCKELGFATGSGGIWGGSAGMEKAYSEAKNNAAKYRTANAMLITSSRMNPTAYVNARVFDCSDTKPQKIAIVSDSSKEKDNTEDLNAVFEKARKCQSKGGAWIEDRCVVPLD